MSESSKSYLVMKTTQAEHLEAQITGLPVTTLLSLLKS